MVSYVCWVCQYCNWTCNWYFTIPCKQLRVFCSTLQITPVVVKWNYNYKLLCLKTCNHRGAGASPTGTTAAGPMLGAKLMNLIKGQLQKFWLSNNFSIKFTRSRAPAASPDQSWYASDATESLRSHYIWFFNYYNPDEEAHWERGGTGDTSPGPPKLLRGPMRLLFLLLWAASSCCFFIFHFLSIVWTQWVNAWVKKSLMLDS